MLGDPMQLGSVLCKASATIMLNYTRWPPGVIALVAQSLWSVPPWYSEVGAPLEAQALTLNLFISRSHPKYLSAGKMHDWCLVFGVTPAALKAPSCLCSQGLLLLGVPLRTLMGQQDPTWVSYMQGTGLTWCIILLPPYLVF